MAGLERLADRELGAMEALFVMGDGEVYTRSTVIMLVRLDRGVDFAEVTELHERASRLVPHLRRRVIAPVLPISRPYWTVDPDFDINYHVRRVRVPGQATEQDLLDIVESIGQVPVDPARPLWDVTSLEGLADGTGALVYKFHHAIADGEGAREIFSSVFLLEQGGPAGAMPPMPAAEDVTRLDLTRQRASQLPYELIFGGVAGAKGLVSGGAGIVRHPRTAISSTVGYLQSLRRTAAPVTTEYSPLLQRRGIRRRYATMALPLADLRQAGRALGVSLNSVYVAAAVGGVTQYHHELGVSLPELAVAMPVSVRRPGDKAEANHFVAARIAAPGSGTDMADRARVIAERVRAVRDESAIEAVTRLAPVMSRVPLWLTTAMMGSMSQAELQISNVAGYPHATYFGDAKVTGFYGFGPLAGAALMIVMNTADGGCHFAVNMDLDAITDPVLLVSCIEKALDEVVALG